MTHRAIFPPLILSKEGAVGGQSRRKGAIYAILDSSGMKSNVYQAVPAIPMSQVFPVCSSQSMGHCAVTVLLGHLLVLLS